MSESLSIPPAIEETIERLDRSPEPFTELDVSTALIHTRGQLANPNPAENKGAWAECVAFALMRAPGTSVWGTHFGALQHRA